MSASVEGCVEFHALYYRILRNKFLVVLVWGGGGGWDGYLQSMYLLNLRFVYKYWTEQIILAYLTFAIEFGLYLRLLIQKQLGTIL